MTRWLLSVLVASVLIVAPASAQTASQAKPAQTTPAPTSKPPAPTAKPTPGQKPAAPTQKPAPATPTAKPAAPPAAAAAAAPAVSAVKHGPGIYAHITTTQGVMTARLFQKEVPRTVENFVGLAEGSKSWRNPRTNAMVKRPYYTNLTFHRVIPGFMIQGGDPLGTGTGGPGFAFPDEFHPKLRHSKAGILSMANSGPNTNGGQFFITLVPTPHLDNRHSVFGELVEGMDVLAAIGKVPTMKANNRPVKPVIIRTVRIERVS
jgi:peptidyl-prolyl cis-trans isomerase A (cyclophilin A)